MKVLQINAIYGQFSTGRIVKELHEEMEGRGIDCYVASPIIFNSIENVYKIGNVADQKFHAMMSRISGRQGYFSKKATKRLLRYMDDIKPDIVVLHNLHSNYINLKLLLGYLADHHIASICVLHDCWLFTGKCMHFIEFDCNRWTKKCGKCPAKHNGNTSFFFDKSSKCLTDKKKYFEKIDRLGVIAVSKWVAESAAGSILKGAAMIRHIYNWIDLEIFRPQSCENFWGGGDYQIRESFIIFGISAGWSASKGIDVLTELADILPADCRIVLAGDVSEISETNNKIKLLGTVTDIDLLAKMYAMSDVFVNPSIQETFGLTTAEALACGTPVVAYNATANTELVGTDESCGFLVDENKAENYLQNILKIKEKSKEYYAAAARKRAEEMFCKDKNIRQYIDTFKSLLAM